VTTSGTQMLTSWQDTNAQLVSITQDTWQAIVDTITQQGAQAVDQCGQISLQILDIFNQLATALYQAGVTMMQQLAAGITAGGQQAVAAARNVAQQIQGLFPQSPAKWGPLSGEGDPQKAGGRIMKRTAAGIDAEADKLLSSLSSALAPVTGLGDVQVGASSAGGRSLASATAGSTSGSSGSSVPTASTGGQSIGDLTPADVYGLLIGVIREGMSGVEMGIRDDARGGLATLATRQQRQTDRAAGNRGRR
jgi:hypothetical protein